MNKEAIQYAHKRQQGCIAHQVEVNQALYNAEMRLSLRQQRNVGDVAK